MKITKMEIPVRDLYEGYINDEESGVFAYDGKLCCRPPYQREFCYKDKQRDAVINSVRNGFPLNTMYWAVTPDGYELLDGQQRTLSLMEYIDGSFSINFQYFFNLTPQEQDEILDYKLDIYVCDGTDAEKLEWFEVINTVGERLTQQELRNAVYTGPWLIDAKRYFSKTGCPAFKIADDLMSGSAIRQDYLESVLEWIANAENTVIEQYMANHQHDTSAIDVWTYFQKIVDWVRHTFPVKRSIMKGVEWGVLYNKYHANKYDADVLEAKIVELLACKEVTKQKGVYEYVLGGDASILSVRTFDDRDKQRRFAEVGGVCECCGKTIPDVKSAHADHIVPWSKGGETVYSNLRILCVDCNIKKSNEDAAYAQAVANQPAADFNIIDISSDDTDSVANPDSYGIPGFIHQ